MNDEILDGQVRELMADTFGVDEADLSENPSQATLARWTSLSQMVLLAALEEQFGLSFSMDEMTTLTSLERIVTLLRQKLAIGVPA